MFPPKTCPTPSSYISEMALNTNSAQGLMLRFFLQLHQNAQRLQDVLPRIKWSSLYFASAECTAQDIENLEHIMLDADTCDSKAAMIVQQSLCLEWHLLGKERFSASSKSHRIPVCETDLRSLHVISATKRNFGQKLASVA